MTSDDADREALERYAATRDPAIRDELVERFRGLALYHARRYVNRGLEREDLEQVAMIGLINAIDRFEPSRNVDLATYAGRTIDGELKRHFRDKGWAVRVPRGVRDLSVAVRRTVSDLEGELGRAPRPGEVAERMGVDTDAVLEALDAASAFRTAPLEMEDHTGDTRPRPAVGGPDSSFEDVADRMVVDELLETLPERERRIVALRFFERMTQSEIAEQVGISQMHVSRLLRRSLLQLRENLRDGGAGSGDVDQVRSR